MELIQGKRNPWPPYHKQGIPQGVHRVALSGTQTHCSARLPFAEVLLNLKEEGKSLTAQWILTAQHSSKVRVSLIAEVRWVVTRDRAFSVVAPHLGNTLSVEFSPTLDSDLLNCFHTLFLRTVTRSFKLPNILCSQFSMCFCASGFLCALKHFYCFQVLLTSFLKGVNFNYLILMI